MQKSLALKKNGRKINFIVSGAENGAPTLYINGAGMDGSLTFENEHLVKNNIHLFSIDRPGFGASDPVHDKTFHQFCEDIKILLKYLNLKKINCIGFSQGSVFAYSLCANNLIDKCIIVSGQDDFNYSDTFALLNPDVQQFVENAKINFESISTYFQNQVSASGFLDMVIGMSSSEDQAIYGQEVYKQKYLFSLSNGLEKSMKSYLQDLKLCISNWPFQIEDIENSVFLFYGLKDSSTVHSPDFGKMLTQRNPNFILKTFKEYGGALIWTHPDDILKVLS